MGFMAENSMSFSSVPRMVAFCQEVAIDKKALDEVKLERTSATYKLCYGVAKTFEEELLHNLRISKFSLNIDEATSNGNQCRVLAVLVSYFSSSAKLVEVHHLASLELIRVNSSSIEKALSDLFLQKDIPWSNCMAILMDSCAVMRGRVSGVEKRIRDNYAPHLLNIDGDSCHHVHNGCKALCKPFDKFLENFFHDVHTDMFYSADLKEAMQALAQLLGIAYTNPVNYVSHRWLSVYESTIDVFHKFDLYTVFYAAFLKGNDKALYNVYIKSALRKNSLSTEAKKEVQVIQDEIGKKNMTQQGQDRKKRIIQVLFVKRLEMKMVLSFYKSVLPLLKNYTLLFEKKSPLIHKLHDKQVELFKEVLGLFIRPEVIPSSPRALKELNVSSSSNLLKQKQMFIGNVAKDIVQSSRKDDQIAKEFLERVQAAYIACAQKLQKSLPLENELFQCCSAIDPVVRKSTAALTCLEKLPKLVTNVLQSDELDEYSKQVRAYTGAEEMLFPIYQPDSDARVDAWWGEMYDHFGSKYSLLLKVIVALLSCFHGPQVESTFNLMGDVMDSQRNRMNIATLSAVQTVKYSLLASGKTACQYYHKKDFVHDPVNSNLCTNLRKAHIVHSERMKKKREEKQEKQDRHKLHAKTNIASNYKRKVQEESEEAAKRSRICHTEEQIEAVRARKKMKEIHKKLKVLSHKRLLKAK